MSKTKRQLRAEAVERLGGMALDTGSAVKKLAIALGVEWNPYNAPASMGALKSALIDLLTDDEPPEGSSEVRAGSSNEPSKPRVSPSNDGVGRSMTELEWLFENDRDFVADWVSMARYCRYCAFNDDCDGSMGADDPKCIRGNREWLMSERVDDLGHSRTMSENGADCVRNGGETSENGVSAGRGDPNGGKPAANPLQDGGMDTREKLEADLYELLLDACEWTASQDYPDLAVSDYFNDLHRKPFHELLDRQAAITERECREYEDALRDRHHARVAELKAITDKLCRCLENDYGIKASWDGLRMVWTTERADGCEPAAGECEVCEWPGVAAMPDGELADRIGRAVGVLMGLRVEP